MRRFMFVLLIIAVLFTVWLPVVWAQPLCIEEYMPPFELQQGDGTWTVYIYSNLDCRYIDVGAGLSDVAREESSAMVTDFSIILFDYYEEVRCVRGDESFC